MIEQAKILRVFSLIRLLKQWPGHSITALVGHLDPSTRIVRRYLELLEEVGYDVDSQSGRYFIK